MATVGGASHYNWVLSIGDELGKRGHNFTFVTCERDTKFAKPFDHVATHSVGPCTDLESLMAKGELKELMKKGSIEFLTTGMELMQTNYEQDFLGTKQYFIDNNIDLALCDHFSDACMDAATVLRIPFIYTGSLDLTKDSSAPYINDYAIFTRGPMTTEFESITTRFYNKFILPMQIMKKVVPSLRRFEKRRRAVGVNVGLQDPTTRLKNTLKLIDNLHGFNAPRPSGSLVENVGPVLPKKYTPLTRELKEFLDMHNRVAYVAFGSKATPSEKEICFILRGILENIEHGDLDGFIWATVHAAGFFPDSITTSSNTTYFVHDMFNGYYSNIRMTKWAPQTAILHHPSTYLFLSHGGLTSWFESMHSGTRMIMFPFFGDQPANAHTVEQRKLGGILKSTFTMDEAVALFKRIIKDETNEITESVKRFQALAQIYTRNSITHAADIVEEVAYTHVNGRLLHRESADRRMSYIRAHNIDIWAMLFALVGIALSVGVLVGYKVLAALDKQQSATKVKTN
ncbi:hypothetical protein BDF20DRAFT_896890 [Mycotypha africana]|uniref:uncharacterized protein n=1 Tax=Mycotypha africana TaxID=64632 RepID=UPI002300B978|nr:uncharacterized protein BDF20DRAFT_896890 [Mycotypha africana]KAI8968528.1 hypothetical protein BDF20DRAFT_896890 [Mycotypha africana]